MISTRAVKDTGAGSHGWGFDALPIPMAVLDEALDILEVNAAFAELLGVPAASLLGEPFGRRVRAAALEAPEGEGVQTFQFQCPDGPRWLRLDLQRKDDTILALLVDVDGERTILQRFKADSAARDRIMDDAAIGMWRFDPDQNLYHFSSQIRLGYLAAEGPTPVRLVRAVQHPDDRRIDDEIRERLTREEGSAGAEIRYRSAGGDWWHARVLYRSGRKLKSGRYEMYGLSQNITDLAIARDGARESAGRLKLALAAARAGVFGYDYAKAEYWLSQEFRDLVGEEIVARGAAADDPRVMFHEEDRDTMRSLGQASVRAGRPATCD
ncbi:MAG: PAS domain-containing protein, partial [Proteobacteria bacterium]|nr:PAS domain-containing protein [Pseudomonadota bacterium]